MKEMGVESSHYLDINQQDAKCEVDFGVLAFAGSGGLLK